MPKRFRFGLSLREGVIGLIIVLAITFLGRWAYFFLPDEYAAEVQMPDLQSILVIGFALLYVYVCKIAKEINAIKKQLETKAGADGVKAENDVD